MSRPAAQRSRRGGARGPLWAAVLLLAGCSGDESAARARTTQPCAPCTCAPAGVVDAPLLAFLSKARSAHHQADIAEQADEPRSAIAALERLVDEPTPGARRPAPEAREVLADTYARLAELRSSLEQFPEARADVRRGLELATDRTHFRGRLMEVRGLVEERQAEQLAARGEEQAAREANARAVAAFEAAIDIQAHVIEQALSDAGASPDAAGALEP